MTSFSGQNYNIVGKESMPSEGGIADMRIGKGYDGRLYKFIKLKDEASILFQKTLRNIPDGVEQPIGGEHFVKYIAVRVDILEVAQSKGVILKKGDVDVSSSILSSKIDELADLEKILDNLDRFSDLGEVFRLELVDRLLECEGGELLLVHNLGKFPGLKEGRISILLDKIHKLNPSKIPGDFLDRHLGFRKGRALLLQDMLTTVAKVAVKNVPNWLSQNIKNFGITDQDVLIDIVMAAVKNAPIEVSNNLRNFGITDRNTLIAIATFVAEYAPIEVSKNIHQYGITDQDVLTAIAKIAVEKDPGGVSEYIRNYGIIDQTALREIAMVAAEKDPGGVSEHIRSYGITDQTALREIAMVAAEKDAWVVLVNIQKYGIKDQDALREIANIFAERVFGVVSKSIQKYGITDQNVLIAIAMAVADKDVWVVLSNIQNYGITDRAVLREIANIAVKQYDIWVYSYIQKYGITDQDVLIAIAMAAAEKDVWGVLVNIQKYGIKDQDALIAIAKIAEDQDAGMGAQNIHGYGITDQNVLIAIAMAAAEKDAWGVLVKIQNYGIRDQNALIAIAKIAEDQDDVMGAQNIQKYGIKDQDVLIAIAMAAAEKDAWGVLSNIQNYGIRDQNALIAIAKLAAEQDFGLVLVNINNYEMKEQNVLKEIAKLAAENSGMGVSAYIQQYGITEQDALTAIAKIAAEKDAWVVSECIQNYGITDQNALTAIAKIAAEKDAWVVSEYIQNYGIIEESNRVSVFLEAFKQLSDELNISNIEDLLTQFSISMDSWNAMIRCDNVPKKIKDKISELRANIKGNSQVSNQMNDWLDYTSCLLMLLKDNSEKDQEAISKFLDALNGYRNPKMRYVFIDLMMKRICVDKDILKQFNQYASGSNSHRLPAVILALLDDQLRNKGDESILFEGLRGFPDIKHQYVLIDTLYALLEDKTLGVANKLIILKILKKASNPENRIKNLKAVYGILQNGGGEKLKEALESMEDDLSNGEDILESVILSIFQENFPLVGVENFINKYKSTFGIFRDQEALISYKGKMNQLTQADRNRMSDVLNVFVTRVLNGTFISERYSEENNAHLRTIFNGRPDLKTEWCKGAKGPVEPLVSAATPEINRATDRLNILSKNVNSLPAEGYNPLRSFIKNPEKREELRILLTAERDEAKKKKDGLTGTKANSKSEAAARKAKVDPLSKEINAMNFQLRCMSLCNDVTYNRSLLGSISKFLVKLKCGDFAQAIAAYREKSPKQRVRSEYEGWTVVDSDDAQDLFLCGTEVTGSCQGVGASPKLNKCLMGYVMNGQTRVVVVKNGDGRIVARSVLRLLWDDTNKKPVLLLEKLYTSGVVSQVVEDTVVKMAKSRAKTLGLPLLSTSITSDDTYNGTVRSLGGVAPYEYCDAVSGVMPDGVFEINSPMIIYKPKAVSSNL